MDDWQWDSQLERAFRMARQSFEQEITSRLHKLSPEQQKRVLAFVRNLTEEKPSGVPGRELLRFAGAIDSDHLREMEKAIAEGCEQVRIDDW
jgi:hypothetical protein